VADRQQNDDDRRATAVRPSHPVGLLKDFDQDAAEFFERYEEVVRSYNWNETLMAENVSLYVRGMALLKYKNIPIEFRQDYEMVKRLMIEAFNPGGNELSAMKAYSTIQKDLANQWKNINSDSSGLSTPMKC
jgi:hypothetical protein